jgi:Protein of unknown function (DUF1214)
MKKMLLGWALRCASALSLAVTAALAADAPRPPAAPIAGWNEFIDGLRILPGQMLAKLPESLRNDPQVQQEVGRLILESLAASSLDAIGGDGDHPFFLPNGGLILDVAAPNADTIYRVARITPGGSYRLRGQRGTLRMVNIGQVGPTPGERGVKAVQPGPTKSYLDVNALHVDAQGRFDLILSPTRPAGYSGDWWQLLPASNKLLLRMVSADWGREREPTISIERIDRPPQRSRPSAADLEQRLRGLAPAAAFLPMLLISHVENLREQGYVNKLKVLDVSQIGGLTGQSYYEGAYDLREDEALVLEAKVPAKCTYYSVVLVNDIHETTDWYNNHSSLNDSQAKPDKDGVLRIVVSAKDAGVPNWLDTAGYSRGVVHGRWVGCEAAPVPSARKVRFAELRQVLPPDTPVVTPAQRETVIRARRSALQQRPLW